MSLLSELRRRHVFKVGAAYLVVAWLVLQVANIVSPILELPDVVEKVVFFLLLLGFPIALILAWAFELTPDGIGPTKPVGQSTPENSFTGRRFDFLVIGILVIAVALFAFEIFVRNDPDVPVDALTDEQETIAVLPFVNISNDPEQQFFSDGLSEELLNLLAQIPELRVTSRTSAFSFKGKTVTIPEVGQTLGVRHVLEGSVRRSGDKIRITAQLIEAASDSHVWSQTWDRDFKDVFAIQDEIAAAVVGALKVRLLDEVPHVPETTPEAYELYLRSKFLMEQFTADNFVQALAINDRVLELDRDYSPAWTQRALIYWHGAAHGAWENVDATPLAREAAQKSVSLDPRAAEPHAILAYIAIDYDYDYETAEDELDTALDLEPDNITALRAAAEYELRQGNLAGTINHLEKAQAIDPLTSNAANLATAYFYTGQQEKGISYWRERVEQRPTSVWYRRSLALALFESGDVEGAFEEIEKEPSEAYRLQALALMHEALGNREESTEALEGLVAEGQRWTWEIAEVYAARGELDEAFHWLDLAIERRDRGLRHVMYNPNLAELRKDPRFDELRARLGL